MTKLEKNIKLYGRIIHLLNKARNTVIQAVNKTMVITYFEIGKIIVEEEQKGKERASYGKGVLKGLSEKLNKEFGRGFSVDNLENMRRFYLVYSISETLSRKLENENSETLSRNLESNNFQLSWSHYIFLIRIEGYDERSFYEIESINNGWSLRELRRQFNSALFERLSLSRDKKAVKKLAKEGQIIKNSVDSIKDPYILEFLGLPDKSYYSESELEQKIIDKLEHFILELGKGFTFVGRQVRFTFDDKHFKVDLVFYNRILRCFVLIDLKIGEILHKDLGQMQMYVNYYDRKIKLENENKTIGIILCKKKNEALVEFSLPEGNDQIFASNYQTVLPSKSDLKRLIESKDD